MSYIQIHHSDTGIFRQGDSWNGENFSWFSQSRARPKATTNSLLQNDQSLDMGGRLLSIINRPYPAKIAGLPIAFNYESDTGSFSFTYRNPSSPLKHTPARSLSMLGCCETEIFIPSSLVQGRRMIVTASDKAENFTYDSSRQTLFVVHRNVTPDAVHSVHVAFDPPLQGRLARRSRTPILLVSLAVLLLAFIISLSLQRP